MHGVPPDSTGPVKPLRIALAEDEPLTLRYLEETLTLLGHDVVVTARNGVELLEKCRLERPDLVLTDIQMPMLSGLEAARTVCCDLQTPVVLVTGHDFIAETAKAAEECPILLYLVKPATERDLALAIRTAMLRHAQLKDNLQADEDVRVAFANWRRIEMAKRHLMQNDPTLDERQAIEKLRLRARESGQTILQAAEAVLEKAGGEV